MLVSDSGKQPVPASCAQGIVPLKPGLFLVIRLCLPVLSLLFGGEHVLRPGHEKWPPSGPDQTHSILSRCLHAKNEESQPSNWGSSVPPSLPTARGTYSWHDPNFQTPPPYQAPGFSDWEVAESKTYPGFSEVSVLK